MNVGALLSQRAFSQSPAAPRSRVGRTNPDRALSLKPNKSMYSPVTWSVILQVMAVQDGNLLCADTLPLDALPQMTPGTAAQAAAADLRLTFHPTPSQPSAMTGWAGSIRQYATLSHHGIPLTGHKQTPIVDATLTRRAMPKFFELFAGAGGMTMGFEAASWECVGHAEIEPHARAVLRHKWPEVPLYGDVAQLDGTTLPPFDLLTFGAPCQDLSIAGKRAGMTEGSGTRSSLFFEAIRIWKESSAPLALYENVLGAYSSNDGKDFAAVLSAFVGAPVPVPADGWRGAGVASGPAGVAAWRTVDLQHFGWDGNTTPQRRRRVFVLGTRTGDYDPAEVLLVADGLLGNLATSGEAGEGIAEDAPTGPAIPSLPTGFSTTGSVGYVHDVMPSLPHLTGLNCPGAQMMGVLQHGACLIDTRNATRTTDKDEQNRQGLGIGEDGDPSPTLTGLFTPAVLAYDTTQITSPANYSRPKAGDPCHPLAAGAHPPLAITYDARGNGEGAIANTLSGDHQNRVTDYTALVLATDPEANTSSIVMGALNTGSASGSGQRPFVTVLRSEATAFNWQSGGDVRLEPRTEQANTLQANQTQAVILRNREGKPGGGKGPLVSEAFTSNDQVVFPTLSMGAHTAAPGSNGQDAIPIHDAMLRAGVGVPRRLMPIECERLMGWPDHHTAMGTDEQGRDYALSDTARYKLAGNGVGSAVAAWIGMRLKLALDKT